ncbi:MAG: sensor histidine kinase [Bacilli bacterium]
MKLKTRSLRANLLIYFLIFSAIILGFLYFFQILFFNTYYKINQTSNLEQTVNLIEKNIDKENAKLLLNELSLNNEVCIQIVKDNNLIYYSDYYKHCAGKDNDALGVIINSFINSDKKYLKVDFVNNRYNNKSLVYGKKLKNNTYVFANSSLEPMDKSINLLKGQFLYVALIVLLLSFIISYYFSRRIADPILKINQSAKKLADKNNKVKFTCETEVFELKELSETLNNTAKELNKTEELRREFLANVSHDLKTPLTMIEAYAASARDLNYNNKKKRERDLNIIIDEAERLNMLVNDILLLSKIESKTTKLNLEDINIKKEIETILERFAIYKNDGYIFEFNETEDYIITADKQGIERVIYNLINNAINYTGEDKKVRITFEKDQDILTINIIDTGKGIEDEDKKLVWNKYFRINKRHRRTTIGTGLGLSIVKEILEEHKFEYGIKSKLNKGSCFYFKCKIKENNSNKNTKKLP